MTKGANKASVFREDVYQETVAGATALRSRLPEESLAELAREVIKRIVNDPPLPNIAADLPAPEDVEDLSQALMAPNARDGAAYIERIRAEGASLETIYVLYLRAAALQLGAWWEEDRISFAEVTVATGRIFSIMRALRPAFTAQRSGPMKRSILMASVPDEDHILGVSMATDLLRNEGWEIDLATGDNLDDLIARVSRGEYAVVGLSAAGEHSVPMLAKTLVALRISSPHALVLVAGNIVETSEELVSHLGPDAMAISFEDARSRIEELYEQSIAGS